MHCCMNCPMRNQAPGSNIPWLQSVDSARAMLTLGRMLPRLEVHSQEEVEDGDEEGNHHHDVAGGAGSSIGVSGYPEGHV